MREFIRSWKFKIIVCVFALLFGFMIYAAASGGAASLPERVLKTVASPFVRLSTGISNFVVNNVDKVVNADRYKSENDELRQTISDLLTQIVSIDELKNNNRLLQEMLDISAEHPDFEWPSNICTITAYTSLDPYGGFTINRGSKDGIGLNDFVITGVGVVGRISKVAPNYAVVTTLLSTEFEIGVLTTRCNVKGIIQNDIELASEGIVRVSFIEPNADIEVGDTFVTIGGETYPEKQIIGMVTEVRDDPNGMSKHALVKPSEEITRLTNVLVVTNFEGRDEQLTIDN
ncbi:MAG: rod shape-determining protein MreC [Oscillospiraceae bacterium]|nr:rod shape-determining protein MreC [Oscillospiraceae bacterium]